MLIRSLSVADYRGVSGPIRLALGPGLNVIHGENESGKTTLLEALRNALLVKARSSSEFHRALAPHRGGTPQVEVAFERDGSSFVLTKRFAAAGSTRLVESLATGRASTLEDDAAEDRLRAVLGLADPGRSRDPLAPEHHNFWPLLFVAQNQSDRAPGDDLRDEGRSSLSAALQHLSGEVLDGGGAGADLVELVEARFREHFTAGGSLRRSAGSPRARVEAEAAEAQARLAELTEQGAQQAEALAAHRRASLARTRLAEQLPTLEESADRARKQARTAAVRGAERARALEVARVAELEHRHATERLDRLTHLAAAVAQAEAAAVAAAAEAPSGEEEPPADAPADAPEDTALAAAEAALRLAELGRDALRLEADLASATHRLGQAEQAADALAKASDRRATLTLTGRSLEELRKLADALASAEALEVASREAVASRVEVSVDPAAAGAARLTHATTPEGSEPGEAIEEVAPGVSARHAAVAPVTVELPGQIRVTVTPPARTSSEAQACRQRLSLGLSRAGVASLQEASALANEARDLDAAILRFRETLALHAPEGIESARAAAAEAKARRATQAAALSAALAASSPGARTTEVASASGGDPSALPAEPSTPEAAEAAVDAARARRDRVAKETQQRQRRRAEAERAAADARQARALAQQAARRAEQDLASARQSLKAYENEQGNREQLRETRGAAAAALREAESTVAALPPVDSAAADADAERTERAHRAALAEAAEHERTLAGLHALLHRGDAIGLPDRLEAAELAVERGREELTTLDAEAAAARRLRDTLDRHRRAARERFVAPLRQEVDRLLPRLFPGATTRFDADFGGLQIERQGTPEDHAQLSAGGREQVGVLVRLAMARVLAGEGTLPLLLDDPLTHTDDDRFEAMAAVLNLSAPPLQVLLATCHWSRHRILGVEPSQVFDLSALR